MMAKQWISDNIKYICMEKLFGSSQSFISSIAILLGNSNLNLHLFSSKMKVALFLLVIFSVVLAVSSVPAPDEELQLNETKIDSWFNNPAWQFLMCKLRCRSSCLEQGYWNGACKAGATCHCFGFRGPMVQDGGFPMGF